MSRTLDVPSEGRSIHGGGPVLASGPEFPHASAAAVLVHGRGATADGMLALAEHLRRDDVLFIAPQAAGNVWYPFPFMTPSERNEPWLTSALDRLTDVVRHAEGQGIPRDRLMLLGFSQGACLALEWTARNGGIGAVAGLSGGLIGATLRKDLYRPVLAGTTVFLGCSDIDPHIPVERVNDSAVEFRSRGAAVTARIYPGMAHTVNRDELDAVAAELERLTDRRNPGDRKEDGR